MGNIHDLDEAALSELSRKTLSRIREKNELEKIPDKELMDYMETLSKSREALTRAIKRPKNHEEVKLMSDRTELRERLNLILGTIEGELSRRKKSESWNF